MTEKDRSPLQLIIDAYLTQDGLAEALRPYTPGFKKLSQATISIWLKTKVPPKYAGPLVALARKKGLKITKAQLCPEVFG